MEESLDEGQTSGFFSQSMCPVRPEEIKTADISQTPSSYRP